MLTSSWLYRISLQRVLQDVGMMTNDMLYGPGSKIFILLNRLSVTNDDVLGDYEAWVTSGVDGTEWLLTARSGGELIWASGGVVTDNSESTRYTATVTEYTESDCRIYTYGEAHGRSSSIAPFPDVCMLALPSRQLDIFELPSVV